MTIEKMNNSEYYSNEQVDKKIKEYKELANNLAKRLIEIKKDSLLDKSIIHNLKNKLEKTLKIIEDLKNKNEINIIEIEDDDNLFAELNSVLINELNINEEDLNIINKKACEDIDNYFSRYEVYTEYNI